jgi:hypothetical protein
VNQELLQNGFQLAYFIVRHRPSAIQTLSNAMSKASAQDSREKKRRYWRDKYLKRKISRITREGRDIVQWLIYSESESYEKRQEQSGELSTRDMVVRYIKYLVQLTTAMSSFYVNIALQRLLHNYSTSETQQLYEWLTDSYPGSQHYRKVKSMLIKKLEARFDRLLRTSKSDYGEVKFEMLTSQARWVSLVEKCLYMFTPWSTTQSCWVPARLEAGAVPSKLLKDLLGNRDQDVIEMYRCHAFIEPDCSYHLMTGLGLSRSSQRLAIPRFFINGDSADDHDHDSDQPTLEQEVPNLSRDEEQLIRARLAEEAARRRRIVPQRLRILSNSAEYARLDLAHQTEWRCEISEGIKLIEIWAEDQAGEILWAKHWVEYTEWQGIAQSGHVVDLGNGRELVLRTAPNEGGASLWLKCRPASRPTTWREDLRLSSAAFHDLPQTCARNLMPADRRTLRLDSIVTA